MINWLKGSTKTQKSDLKNLPEVNMADWMTSGESAEFSKLLQTPLLRMAIRIVAESMPFGPDNLVGTCLRRQNDRPKQLMAAKAITQRVSGNDAFVLMTPIRGEPVMAIVPDASSRCLAS